MVSIYHLDGYKYIGGHPDAQPGRNSGIFRDNLTYLNLSFSDWEVDKNKRRGTRCWPRRSSSAVSPARKRSDYWSDLRQIPPLLLKMKRILFASPLLLAAAMLSTTPAQAQGYAEGVGLSYENVPLRFAHPTAEQSAFHADVWRGSLVIPRTLGADSTQSLLFGATAEMLRFGGPRERLGVASVYGFSPLLGYRRRVGEGLELTALALPQLNSDLRRVQARDVQLGGVVRLAYRRSPRLSYRATVGYRSQFFGPQYVLLLGLDWHPAGSWRVFGDLPTSLTISHGLGARSAAGFTLTGLNAAYRLRDQNQYLQYQQGHYGLFIEGYASAHWAVRATVAYAVTRRVGVFAENDQYPATVDYIGLGQEPQALSAALAKGPAFRLSLSYRVPQP